MSIKREKTDKECPACGRMMERVWIKSPFVDDGGIECVNYNCHNFNTVTDRARVEERCAEWPDDAGRSDIDSDWLLENRGDVKMVCDVYRSLAGTTISLSKRCVKSGKNHNNNNTLSLNSRYFSRYRKQRYLASFGIVSGHSFGHDSDIAGRPRPSRSPARCPGVLA